MVLSSDVFFSNQKTAYEGRVSDWSSDVCSSDLQESGVDLRTRLAVAKIVLGGSRRHPIQASVLQRLQPSITLPRAGPPIQLLMHLEAALKRHNRPDRKRVGSGTGESVRVELGGRRYNKKNNETK